MRSLFGLVCVASLSACGGGSGSASAPSPDPAAGSVTLTPSRTDLVTYEGEQDYFTITATSSNAFAASVTMRVGEKLDVTSPVYDTTRVSPQVYRANMHTGISMRAGVHETNLEVRMCEDSPALCKMPVAGSPWVYPVKVTVKSQAEGAARVTVSPAMELTTASGKALSFTVNVKAVAPFGRQVFAGVFDSSGAVVNTSPSPSTFVQDYSAVMLAPSTLYPGVYNLKLEVRLCQDSALSCQAPMSGSPWIVPVKLTVKA